MHVCSLRVHVLHVFARVCTCLHTYSIVVLADFYRGRGTPLQMSVKQTRGRLPLFAELACPSNVFARPTSQLCNPVPGVLYQTTVRGYFVT
jgi:hypothetical protein